jgi:hypothetical protein
MEVRLPSGQMPDPAWEDFGWPCDYSARGFFIRAGGITPRREGYEPAPHLAN